MPIAMIAAAAATVMIAAPQILNPKAIITPDDYPAEMLRQSKGGTAIVKVIVGPDGKQESCAVVDNIGDKAFGEVSCARVMARAQFLAAKDADGKPSYGVFFKFAHFWLPDEPGQGPESQGPDVTLTVARLPGGGAAAMSVKTDVLVDDKGVIVGCTVPPDETNSKLATAACGALQSYWSPTMEKDKSGTPITYVRKLTVSFLPQAPTAN